MKTLTCPACGAPLRPNARRCNYCGNYIQYEKGIHYEDITVMYADDAPVIGVSPTIGCITVNELRIALGYEPIEEAKNDTKLH